MRTFLCAGLVTASILDLIDPEDAVLQDQYAVNLHQKLNSLHIESEFLTWNTIVEEELNLESLTIDDYILKHQNYEVNVKRAMDFNAEKTAEATYGPSIMDHLSDEEYDALLALQEPSLDADVEYLQDIPVTDKTDFDWNNQKAVTAVKSQGGCGSCWAFSAMAAIETRWVIDGGSLTAFSEQQILDCNPSNYGCRGGIMKPVVNGLGKMHHMQTMAEYPYTAKKGECKADPNSVSQFHMWSYILGRDKEPIMTAVVVKYGTLAVAVDAGGQGWRNFNGGVTNAADCAKGAKGRINHGVAVTGFGSLNGVPYWNVKNSWGKRWADKGYIRLKRGENTCLIMSYVLVVEHRDTPTTLSPVTTRQGTTAAPITTAVPVTTAAPITTTKPAPTDPCDKKTCVKCAHKKFPKKGKHCTHYCIKKFKKQYRHWCNKNCKCIKKKTTYTECVKYTACNKCVRTPGATWTTDGQCGLCLTDDLGGDWCKGTDKCSCADIMP